MSGLPTSPLIKNDLRSLLAQRLQPNSTTGSLSAQALRGARQWAIAANLLNEQGLTPEGQVVATKDPYLETTVTDWLIHFQISTGSHSLWKYVVYNFLPEHPTFTEDELLNSCTQAFTIEAQDKLKKSLRLILKTYTESQAIASIRFITHQKKQYSTDHPNLSNSHTTGYFLAKVWEHHFQSRESILVNEILVEEIGLNSVIGINQESFKEQLDILAEHKIIEQRSAKPHRIGTKSQPINENEFPYQICRCWESSIELLERAYENDMATPNRPLIQSLAPILEEEDSTPDFLKFLEWASRLTVLDGGSNTIAKLVS